MQRVSRHFFFFFFAKSFLSSSKFFFAAPPTTLQTFLSEKSRSTKISPTDKTILFGARLDRLEQLISIGRGGVVAIERGGARQRTARGWLSIGLLATRRLYTGVVAGCTRGSSNTGMGNGGPYQLCTALPVTSNGYSVELRRWYLKRRPTLHIGYSF